LRALREIVTTRRTGEAGCLQSRLSTYEPVNFL
jgi:hypothetical protein